MLDFGRVWAKMVFWFFSLFSCFPPVASSQMNYIQKPQCLPKTQLSTNLNHKDLKIIIEIKAQNSKLTCGVSFDSLQAQKAFFSAINWCRVCMQRKPVDWMSSLVNQPNYFSSGLTFESSSLICVFVFWSLQRCFWV